MGPMAQEPRSWPRSLHEPTDQRARLLYYVFGKFPASIAPSRSQYRVGSMPPELRISKHEAASPRAQAVLAQPLFARFLSERGATFRKNVEKSPTCMLIHGEFDDPPTLDYLRDTVGLLAYLADNGASAILDAFRLRWWAPNEFKRVIFAPDDPVPLEQTLLLASEEDDGLWIHTRGMQKFARPDLSIRGVSGQHREAVVDMITRFVELMAGGAVVPDGQEIKLASLPAGMTCRHRGDEEDPDFNNTHIEIVWPAHLRP